MAIDIEDCRLLRGCHHPVLAKLGTPGEGLLLVSQTFEFDAQGAHFRCAVDAEKFAPLAWRVIAQRFYRSEPGEGHESQQQEDARQTVKSLRQPKVFVGMTQQATDQQCRQSQQDAAIGEIERGSKSWRRFVQLSQACCQSFQRRGRPASHRSGTIRFDTLAFAARRRAAICLSRLAGDAGYGRCDLVKGFFLVACEPVLPGSLSATCSASPSALRQPPPP